MAMVSVVLVAAYRQIWGSGWLASKVKGRWLLVACAALSKWTGWTLAVAVHWYNDSIINIVVLIYLIITIINTCVLWMKQHTLNICIFCHLFLIVIHCTSLTESYCLRYSIGALVYLESEKL